jgi:hypothetical protein
MAMIWESLFMEIRAGADIAVKEKQLVVKWIKRCLREITKAAYELPVDYPTARSDIRITIKGGVTIDIVPFRKQHTHVLEYPAFAKDRVIGSRDNVPAEIALAATVAHEISHFVQYRYGPDTRWLQRKYRKPHGEGFQDIYRILRSRVVNSHAASLAI